MGTVSSSCSHLIGNRYVGDLDIPTIYEYWVLFQLLNFLRDRWGDPVETAPLVSTSATAADVPDGFRASYRNGAVLRFQAEIPSYSRLVLRPDFSLNRNGRLLLLDAKYRKTGGEGALYGNDGEAFGQGTFQSDDLIKMHAYRDALPGAVGAWAIYPGSSTRTFESKEGIKVGALALCPGAARANQMVLEELGQQLAWFLDA